MLVPGSPGRKPKTTDKLYERSLRTEAGRRTIRTALDRAAAVLGGTRASTKWDLLRFELVNEVVESLLESEENYSPATINLTLAALKGVARTSWLHGRMDVDDYMRIRAVKRIERRRVRHGRTLCHDELEALLLACASDPNEIAGARDWAVITLLGGAGLRRSEAAALDLKDLDRRKYTIFVRGKGGHERIAYLKDDGARQALDDWLELRGTPPGPLLSRVHSTGTILADGITAQAIYDLLRRRAKQADVARFSPHDLRYTFGTAIIDGGGDLPTVQKLLGHASIETTTVYDLRTEQGKERAAGLVHFPTRYPRPRKPRGYRRRKRRAPRTPMKFPKKLMRQAAKVAFGDGEN